MNERNKLTGPEWDALKDALDNDSKNVLLSKAVAKVEGNFVSDHWYSCPECGEWIGPVLSEVERVEGCNSCHASGMINTYGKEVSFKHWE